MGLSNAGPPPVLISMTHQPDEDGLGIRMHLASHPGATTAVFGFLDDRRTRVRAHPPYGNLMGVLAQRAPVEGSSVRLYVPYGAIGHQRPGQYVPLVELRGSDGGVCGVFVFPHLPLPAPRRYSAAQILAPLVGLVMAVIRADAAVTSEEVRLARNRLTRKFGLRHKDLSVLRDLMKAPVPTDLAAQVKKLAVRFPHGTTSVTSFLIDLAIELARTDGRVVPSEVAVIRQIAAELYPGKAFQPAWTATVEQRLRAVPDPRLVHLATLGLEKGATAEEISAAWRSKVKQYHPDRFMAHPLEFRELATRRTAEFNRAYGALRSTQPTGSRAGRSAG